VSYRLVDELDIGFGWELDERFTRTSHALADGRRVWLIDPVDVPGLDERVGALGEPAGVIQLLDRHARDCAALAARHGVAHHVVPDALPDTPFEIVPLLRWPKWREDALWWPERRVLVTADAIGTNRFFLADGRSAAIHPMLRVAKPPRALAAYQPEHLLVGHGEGIHGPAVAEALREALRTARTGVPRWLVGLPAALRRS
jgi:hypothetical protein